MWPFRSKKTVVPAVRVGNISARWDSQLEFWQFNDGEFSYSFCGNPEFDVAVLNKLGIVKQWLLELDQEIDVEIRKNIDGWSKWAGKKHVLVIDVSELIKKSEIDVTYEGDDEWGDLGVSIVITDGRITDSYSGD